MTGYSGIDAFSSAEIYDLSDLVQGGSSGDANVPLKALADRTQYLFNRLRRWEFVKVVTDNYVMGSGDQGCVIYAQITDNKTVTLPDAESVTHGTRFGIFTAITGVKALTVESINGQAIVDGSILWEKWDTGAPGIYMHDAEKLILIAYGDHWLVERAEGNFYTYGDSFGARAQRGNTLIAQGTPWNRADLPRLALLVTQGGAAVVDDITWLSDPDGLPIYRGCFSSGNGSTTLRIPDERGLTDKYLDLGRGRDIWRAANTPGLFEAEQVGKHDHATHGKGGIIDGITGGVLWFLGITGLDKLYTNNPGGANQFGRRRTPDTSMRTSDNAGLKNIVENIGKIPLIKY